MSKARELANLRGTPTDNNILLQSTAGDAITGGSGTHNFFAGANAGGKTTLFVVGSLVTGVADGGEEHTAHSLRGRPHPRNDGSDVNRGDVTGGARRPIRGRESALQVPDERAVERASHGAHSHLSLATSY